MRGLFLFLALAISISLVLPHNLLAGPEASVVKPLIKKGIKASEEMLEHGGKKFVKKRMKECIGGDSTKLAKVLGIVPKSGFQAHHIIPVECKTHRTLNKIAFDLDIPANGIALPSRPGLSKDLPIHNGFHSSYSTAVKRDLDAIPASLSEAETSKRVYSVIDKYRKLIESGKSLYNNGAPNAWK